MLGAVNSCSLIACGAQDPNFDNTHGVLGVAPVDSNHPIGEAHSSVDGGVCVLHCYDSITYDEHWCECEAGGNVYDIPTEGSSELRPAK